MTFLVPTVDTCVWHDRVGAPSICTVHAPHWPIPQPNFVPFICNESRRTQSRGISAATSTLCVCPLMVSEYSMTAPPSVRILAVLRRTSKHEVVERTHVVPGDVF